jgi:hypothetical protein
MPSTVSCAVHKALWLVLPGVLACGQPLVPDASYAVAVANCTDNRLESVSLSFGQFVTSPDVLGSGSQATRSPVAEPLADEGVLSWRDGDESKHGRFRLRSLIPGDFGAGDELVVELCPGDRIAVYARRGPVPRAVEPGTWRAEPYEACRCPSPPNQAAGQPHGWR